MLKKITAANYNDEVLSADRPVLLDFWAEWCGPCRMLSPVLHEIAEERDDITVGKVNVDEEGELASSFGVVSIPTVVLMVNGQPAARLVGYRDKQSLLDELGL